MKQSAWLKLDRALLREMSSAQRETKRKDTGLIQSSIAKSGQRLKLTEWCEDSWNIGVSLWKCRMGRTRHRLADTLQEPSKRPSWNDSAASTTRLLTGKFEHSVTAPQVNGSLGLINSRNGLPEATLVYSGVLVIWDQERLS